MIEDDLVAAKLLELSLGAAGHDVEIARDATSARRLLASDTHDLVLLDVFLPDGSGLELLQHIRRDLGRATPVIVISGSQQHGLTDRARQLEASDFLPKPFDTERLRELVAGWTG